MRQANGAAALAAALLVAAGRGAPAQKKEAAAPRTELVELWAGPKTSGSVVRGSKHFVDFSPDGKLLAVGQDSSVFVFDLKTKKRAQNLKELWGMNQEARFSPDGRKLAGVVNGAAHGYVWDTATWGKPAHLALDQRLLRWPSLAWLPDNERIVVPAPKGAEIWSVKERKATLLVPFPNPGVVAANRDNIPAADAPPGTGTGWPWGKFSRCELEHRLAARRDAAPSLSYSQVF